MRLTDITQPKAGGGHGTPCSVATGLAHVAEADPELHEDLVAFFNRDPRFDGITYKAAHAAFLKAGARVAFRTIARHRLGNCRCAATTKPGGAE